MVQVIERKVTQEKLEEESKGQPVFFGEVDYNQHGRLANALPAWYFTRKEEEMKEQAAHIRYQLENDLIPYSEKNVHKERLKQLEGRLEKIKMSKPELSGKQKDEIAQYREELGKKISDSMFTYDDMHRGVADAHEEARRMTNPIIPVKADFIKSFGLKAKDGKVSRNDAIRAWKILGRSLGPDEQTNAEVLRRK